MKYDLIAPLRPLALISAGLLAACGGGDGGGTNGREVPVNPGLPEAVTITPDNTGDGWTVSTPTAEGLDSNAVLATLGAIRDGAYTGVDSMVVVRHGRLVAEGYFNGFGRESLHEVRSTGKSLTSALAGIAIEQGLFGLDDPVSLHIPQFENYANMSDQKRAIRIFHLLNMNTALECNDWDPSSPGNEERMYGRQDWIKFILDLNMVNEPGSQAYYCTGTVVVLGHIISLRSGMPLDDYARTYLLAPLGIQQVGWRRSPDGRATGGGGMSLVPRDAARFGALYLNGGTWNGARIVPAAWVEQSQRQVNTIGRDRYGYLWWKRSFERDPGRPGGRTVESYFTSGNGGNFIFVFPEFDMVVVFTGSNFNSRLGDQPFLILTDRLLPAVL
jgi:CubicO group peptidase (beta-lactamase class C family)